MKKERVGKRKTNPTTGMNAYSSSGLSCSHRLHTGVWMILWVTAFHFQHLNSPLNEVLCSELKQVRA